MLLKDAMASGPMKRYATSSRRFAADNSSVALKSVCITIAGWFRRASWRVVSKSGALADQYGSSVSALADRWSRTAAMLRRIEARYRAQAGAQDISAELRKDRV